MLVGRRQIAGEGDKNVAGDYEYKRFIYFPHTLARLAPDSKPASVERESRALMEWNNL